jgi:putative ABC transport system permease protein
MILFQAGFTGLIGYGFGVGLCALMIEGARLRMPDYAAVITYPNLAVAFAMTVVIASASSFIAARRVLRIDPFEIFRS